MHQGEVTPAADRLFLLDSEEVTVPDFSATGYILDVGGGGDGIIGLLKGEQVVAIDVSREELEEAPDGPLKIVMDARDGLRAVIARREPRRNILPGSRCGKRFQMGGTEAGGTAHLFSQAVKAGVAARAFRRI